MGGSTRRRATDTGRRWGDVQLAPRRLSVRRQVVQERLPAGGTSSTSPARSLAARAPWQSLRRWPSAWPTGYAESVVEGGGSADRYVWPGDDDVPMHDRSIARALERACKRAGLPHTSPHRLRHSAASVALGAGAPADGRRRSARARLAEHHRDDLRAPRRRRRPRPRRGSVRAPAGDRHPGNHPGRIGPLGRHRLPRAGSRRGDRPPCKRQVPGSNPGSGSYETPDSAGVSS
jgi:integrase